MVCPLLNAATDLVVERYPDAIPPTMSILSRKFRRTTRESGFTMIELLVVVIIVALLAAVAVPIYFGLRDGAVKSALRANVNLTVKKASIALTQGASLADITANYGAAYVPTSTGAGEVISIVPGDTAGGTTPAAYSQTGPSDGVFHGRFVGNQAGTDGVAVASVAVTTDDGQEFFVYGTLLKSKGAPVNYSYSYTSELDKFSEGAPAGSDTTGRPAAPSLTARVLPDATISEQYADTTIAATGTPAPTLSATGLPAGLDMSAAGVISGTPNDVAKTYSVLVKATNGAGSDSKTYALQLNSKEQPAAFTSGTNVPTGQVGAQYAGFTVSTSGYPVPVLSIKAGGLPAGLSLNTTTGVISGTPTTGGNASVLLEAKNRNATVTQSLTFTVNAPASLTTTSLASAYTGSSYSQQVVASGTPTATVTVDRTTLPAGLTATDNGNGTATISGSATTAGTKSVKITVSNGIGSPQITNLNLTVASSTIYSEDFESYTEQYNSTQNPTPWTYGDTAGACNNRGVRTKNSALLYAQFGNNPGKFLMFASCYYSTRVTAYSPTVTLDPGTYVMQASFAGDINPAVQTISAVKSAGLTTIASANYSSPSYSMSVGQVTFTISQTTDVKMALSATFPSSGGNGDAGIILDNVTIKRAS